MTYQKAKEKQTVIREIKSERKIQSFKSEIERLTDIIKEKEVNTQQNEKMQSFLVNYLKKE